MHPLKHLRNLLEVPKINQGRVIARTATDLVLATPQGSVSVKRSNTDATIYNVGDTVLLANGVVVGKRNREPTVYVI